MVALPESFFLKNPERRWLSTRELVVEVDRDGTRVDFESVALEMIPGTEMFPGAVVRHQRSRQHSYLEQVWSEIDRAGSIFLIFAGFLSPQKGQDAVRTPA
jgi:hypothetical protein